MIWQLPKGSAQNFDLKISDGFRGNRKLTSSLRFTQYWKRNFEGILHNLTTERLTVHLVSLKFISNSGIAFFLWKKSIKWKTSSYVFWIRENISVQGDVFWILPLILKIFQQATPCLKLFSVNVMNFVFDVLKVNNKDTSVTKFEVALVFFLLTLNAFRTTSSTLI